MKRKWKMPEIVEKLVIINNKLAQLEDKFGKNAEAFSKGEMDYFIGKLKGLEDLAHHFIGYVKWNKQRYGK